MTNVVWIALFGALGCLTRYALSGSVYRAFGSNFPFGTLVVNVLGAYAIGVVMEFSLRSTLVPPFLRVAITIGFLGGLTTFSTFSYETYKLLEDGEVLVALGNILASVTICILCTWLGIITARLLST